MHAPLWCKGAQARIRTKSLHILEKVLPKETFVYVKRQIETDLYIWKETYECVPRSGAKELMIVSSLNVLIPLYM